MKKPSKKMSVKPIRAVGLKGRASSVNDPPIVDGVPSLPGEPPLCRCTAFPELPELDDEDEAA